MREYLKDKKFLSMLDEMRIKKHYARLTILTFDKEKPLREIQGIATAGSITVNGEASLRRTINLTISSIENENDISNIENIISLNKKIKVEIGLENPFADYADYGDIIWFPCGVYIINQATTSTSASSSTISISGKDKMCMLDGSCGGSLPASTTFHESQYEDENGDIRVEDVPIFTIIKECITHFGKEPEQNVIINDIDMTAKLSTKYIGEQPIWFSKDYKSFVISETAPENEDFLQHKFIYGQDIGYQETDFTYPGELVFSAGDTIIDVLDKIIESLGNYEYFYDLDGHFVFQEKKNYLNYYYTPITQLNDNYYIKAFSDSKYYYSFIDAKDALSYYNSPKYENIKNDFIVWGEKTNSSGTTKTIQYHLAIDEKPIIDLANQYMWDVKNGKNEHAYYLLEYDKSDYDNVPEQKPEELVYAQLSETKTQEEIQTDIKNYVNTNIINKYSFQDDYFILYIKVSFIDEIQYYRIKLQDKEIKELTYLEDYTGKITKTNIALGVYPIPTDEEDKEDEDSDNSDDSDKDDEEINFYLLELKTIDGQSEFGYYTSDKEWHKVQDKSEDFTLENLNNFITKIQKNYYVKILVNKSFEEENKDYDFSIIEAVNEASANITDKLYSYDSNGEKKEYKFIFPDSYKEIKDNDTILLSQEQHNELIKSLLKYYKDIEKQNDLVEDLILIFNYLEPEDTDEEESSKILLPFLDPVDGKKDQLKVLKDEDILIEQIFILRDEGLYLLSDLLIEIQDAYNSNLIDFTVFSSSNLIEITTSIPEEPELDYEDNFYFTLLGSPCQEWREELFRQALLNNENGSAKGDYDDELLAKIDKEYLWRKQLFDTENSEWHDEWKNQIDDGEGDTWQGWNPAIYIDPSLITYWLDFIDTDQLVSKYSVNKIGRRTKAITKTNMSMLYKLEVPDIIFFENTGEADLAQKIEQYQLEGQAYCALKPSQMKFFSSSATGSTAFDYIRDMLYQYLIYNLTITINCTPRYYLEPNNLIYIDDKKSNIKGEFVISQYTLPLTYNGNMTITANEVLTRV